MKPGSSTCSNRAQPNSRRASAQRALDGAAQAHFRVISRAGCADEQKTVSPLRLIILENTATPQTRDRENTAFAVLPNSLDRLPILRRISTGRQARCTFVPATQIFPLYGMSIGALARKAFSTCSKKKSWDESLELPRAALRAGPSSPLECPPDTCTAR